MDNLPSGKEKGATNWIRHRLFWKETTAGKYFEKRFLQSSLPGHQANTFLLPSFLLWTLLTLSPKSTRQIDKSFVYKHLHNMGWKSLIWFDLGIPNTWNWAPATHRNCFSRNTSGFWVNTVLSLSSMEESVTWSAPTSSLTYPMVTTLEAACQWLGHHQREPDAPAPAFSPALSMSLQAQ